MDFPSDRAPATAPRWDLMDTEGYGGGNSFSVAPLMFLGYMGIYRRKKYVGGCAGGAGDRGCALWGGRALYVSNVSIIFDCSMLLYLLFWTVLGFIFHFYTILGLTY